MRQIISFYLLAVTLAASALAQPTIGSLVNSASDAQIPVDSGKHPIGKNVIAQGSIFSLYGTGVGPATLTYPPGLPLPTSVPAVNGTSISISSGGQKFDAYIVAVNATQANAILPSNTPVGDATVTLTFNGKTSAPFPISVIESRVGIFTTNSQGFGTVAAQHSSDSSAVLLSKAAHPGEIIVLYGTGLGPITTADNVAPGTVQVGSDVIVTIAGQAVKPTYAGRAPSFAGEDQIDVQIPANVDTGCYVPVSVTASGQVSQDFVLPIAKAGSDACTHIFGLSASALAKLDSPGGTVNVGLFQVLSGYAPSLGGAVQGAGGLFDDADATAVFNLYNKIPVAYGAVVYPSPLNSCVVIDQVITSGGFNLPDIQSIGGTELIANPVTLKITGPGNVSANIFRAQSGGGYVAPFIPPILGAGTWTISDSTGGADVGPFNAAITLPGNLLWTNAGNFSSVPNSDLTIVWSGGTTPSNPIVNIYGNSTIVNPTDPSKSRAKSFYCSAPASAGKFVVPASVRAQLPHAASGESSFGSLGIASGGFASFTAPLTKGTLDAGVIDYGEAYILSVAY
jgi:uncharacterized protein (TIGR03437 family)